MRLHHLAVLAALGVVSAQASAAIRITELMYSGSNGEFVELTNTGTTPIDMTGWKFSDSNRATAPVGPTLNGAGTTSTTTTPFDLSGFGTVQPGQSVVFTESTADAFRTAWSLPSSVAVLGDLGATTILGGGGVAGDPTIRTNNGFNLGNGDEVNIYDATNTLIDRLTYGTDPRSQNVSVNTTPANYGLNNYGPGTWFLSAAGDALGSSASSGNDVGNPGVAAVPEPGSLALLGLGALAALRRRRQA